jgi:hypothetical protein
VSARNLYLVFDLMEITNEPSELHILEQIHLTLNQTDFFFHLIFDTLYLP